MDKKRTYEFGNPRFVSEFQQPLSEHKSDEEEDSNDEKDDNSRRIPRVCASSPNEGKNDTSASGEKTYEAEVIDFLELKDEWLSLFGGIVSGRTHFFTQKDEEYDVCNHTDGKIDAKTPSPGNGGENAPKNLSSE